MIHYDLGFLIVSLIQIRHSAAKMCDTMQPLKFLSVCKSTYFVWHTLMSQSTQIPYIVYAVKLMSTSSTVNVWDVQLDYELYTIFNGNKWTSSPSFSPV